MSGSQRCFDAAPLRGVLGNIREQLGLRVTFDLGNQKANRRCKATASRPTVDSAGTGGSSLGHMTENWKQHAKDCGKCRTSWVSQSSYSLPVHQSSATNYIIFLNVE